MDSAHFWEDSNHSVTGIQHIKYERCSSADASRSSCKEEPTLFRYCEGNLNFSTAVTSEDDDFNFHKKKVSRDPMSHRIIEKRRRDRMNNCLADLSRLIPSEYLKKGRGRIEKTEIIEMAIKHMQYLQSHTCNCIGTCDMPQQNNNHEENSSQQTHSSSSSSSSSSPPIITEHYRLGYQECLSETMHFLVEVEGFFAGDTLCVQLINHLQKHCDKILKGDRLNFPRTNHSETTSMSSGSSGKGSHIPLGTSGVSSASPESGSCSDGSRTENKDSVVDSGHPPSAPISVSSATVYVEENSECEGLLNLSSQSQLREMLTASNTAIRTQQCDTVSNRLQIVQTSISPRPLALGSNSPSLPSEIHEKDRSSASLYKFKNNIKQRFSEEHHTNGVIAKHNGFDVPRGYEEILKRKRYSLESNHENCETNHNTRHVLFKRNDSDTCSVSSLTPSPPPTTSTKYLTVSSPDVARSPVPRHSLPASTTHGIPIFALDCRGSFYIPLTIEFDVLAPYLAAVGFNPASDVTDLSSVVLHPVTISVNFQQGIRHRMIQNVQQRPAHLNSHCAPSSPWRSETPSFSSVPKWTYSESS